MQISEWCNSNLRLDGALLKCCCKLQWLPEEHFSALHHTTKTGSTKACSKQTKTASTFHHLSDLLPVHAVALLVDKGAQEVLEPVLDLRLGPKHRHPLPDRMPLHVLQVLDAFHHLQAQSNIFCKGCAAVMGPSAVIQALTYWMPPRQSAVLDARRSPTTVIGHVEFKSTILCTAELPEPCITICVLYYDPQIKITFFCFSRLSLSFAVI